MITLRPPKADTHAAQLADLVERLTARIQAHEPIDLEAELRDHPKFADELRGLLPALALLADASRTPGSVVGSDGLSFGELGDFRLIREVGRGGMGIVYEAEQISLRRRVALKMLPWTAAMDHKQLQRFKNEALAAASLKHDHIVSVYAVGCERGVHYYAMEFIEGQTLAQLIWANRERDSSSGVRERPENQTADFAPGADAPGSPAADTPPVAALSTERSRPRGREFYRRAAELIADAADALEHAHSLGIVHRDVKPANFLLDANGRIYVSDFGLARFGPDTGLTMSGDLVGTLRYMSPEAALAKHGLVDHRTDIYSLGATLYELLTLHPAVRGDDKAEILNAIAWDDPTPLRKLDKSIPAELETITLKCLAKEPGERYATAGEVAEDLRRWLGNQTIRAKPPGWREKAAKWWRRHQHVLTVALVASALIIAVLTLGIVGEQNTAREESRQRTRAQRNLRLALDALDETSWPAMQSLLERPASPGQDELAPIRELLAFYERFGEENGNDPALRLETSKARLRAGELMKQLGQTERAEREIREGLFLAESLALDRPHDPIAAGHRVTGLSVLGEFLSATNRKKDSESTLRTAIESGEALLADDPNNAILIEKLQSSHGILGSILTDIRQAEDHHRRAVAYSDRLLRLDQMRPRYQSRLAARLNNLANFLAKSGRLDEAGRLVDLAIEHQREALKQEPRNSTYRLFLRNHYVIRANIARSQKRPAEEAEAVREQIPIMERLVEEFPAIPDYRFRLAMSLSRYAALSIRAGQTRDSLPFQLRSLALLDGLVSELPAEAKYWNEYNLMLLNVGMSLNTLGQQAEALKHFQRVPETSAEYGVAARMRTRILLMAADHSLRDPKEALRLATASAAKEHNSGEWLLLIAWAQHQLGDSKSALATLDQAAKTPGGDIDLTFIRAMALHRLGERDQARQEFGRAAQGMDEGDLRSDQELLIIRTEAVRELGLTEADVKKLAIVPTKK